MVSAQNVFAMLAFVHLDVYPVKRARPLAEVASRFMKRTFGTRSAFSLV